MSSQIPEPQSSHSSTFIIITFVPMELKQHIIDFLQSHCIEPHVGIVVAVSTGVDSMVLLDALCSLGQKVAVAHVHHGKRQQSDEELNFMVNFCEEKKLIYRTKYLQPNGKPSGENFQAWARKMRYDFFKDVALDLGFNHIATAHHADDKFENFFFYALRGSGLTGITSLQAYQPPIIRPMLGLSRATIEDYAHQQKLTWFEDASNATDEYTRNRIRHSVIPALSDVNENWREGLAATQAHLQADKNLLDFLVAEWIKHHAFFWGDEIHLPLESIIQTPVAETLMFHFLKKIDPSMPWQALANCRANSVGSMYFGHTHEALRDREKLIIRPKKVNQPQAVQIFEETHEISFPFTINFKREVNHSKHNPRPGIEAFDYNKLNFPLSLRPWKMGDKFKPLGMKGFKKISDYLTDAKINRFEKENVWVLTSRNEIVWLVGHRIDDRFKIETNTQMMYLAQLQKPT